MRIGFGAWGRRNSGTIYLLRHSLPFTAKVVLLPQKNERRKKARGWK